MNKLLTAYIADKNDKTRDRLQKYINKHMMAICLLTVEEIATLKQDNFKL